MFQKLKVFLFHAHEDEAMKERLDKNLVMLKRSNQIGMCEDRKIMAGMERGPIKNQSKGRDKNGGRLHVITKK